MSAKLTHGEIRRRLIRLRNYERMYPELKRKYENLKQEFREFRLETERKLAEKDRQIEALMLQAEELKRMVFRKHGSGKDGGDEGGSGKAGAKTRKSPRPGKTYRRPVPPAESVTETRHFCLSVCPDCHHELKNLRVAERYVEDMVLPEETLNVFRKTEKRMISSGWCSVCRKRKSAIPLSGHTVTLGPGIRRFIAYGSIILRLSFDQIRSLCADLMSIRISDGETALILETESENLQPCFDDLLKRIRGQPGAHYDETGWPVQKSGHGNHAWTITGTGSTDTVFLAGRSRGKGNAEELKGGGNENQVGISDDYGVYRNLFQFHQLCWAHPHRKLRDLKESGALPEKKRKRCEKTYEAFAALYEELRKNLAKHFDPVRREKAGEKMKKRFEKIASHDARDPQKLRTLKESLLKNKESYFTCLNIPGIPADNNKAERALRHLVLKRKNSYGSKTQKGAGIMGILSSVLLSLWWRHPPNFFAEYRKLHQTA